MSCPNCESSDVETIEVTESFQYCATPNAFVATFPAMLCRSCHFYWRDHRAEEAIDSAMALYVARTMPNKL